MRADPMPPQAVPLGHDAVMESTSTSPDTANDRLQDRVHELADELGNLLIRQWALETYLGLRHADPVHEPRPADELAAYAGTYRIFSDIITVTVDGDHLLAKEKATAEVIAQLGSDVDADEPPAPIGMLPGSGDRWVVPSGPSRGSKGFFTRDGDGHVIGIHYHGRFVPRVES